MNIILVLIPVTLLVVIVAVGLFFWAVNHQQFDDLDSPGIVPLLEDDPGQGKAAAGAAPSAIDTTPPGGGDDVSPPTSR